jgi:hypothetical protein
MVFGPKLPARASPATKYDFYFTTENTEYQRLDGGAIKLHSRFHTDRILTAIPSVISVPSVVKNAICILPLAVPEPPFELQSNFFAPRKDSER